MTLAGPSARPGWARCVRHPGLCSRCPPRGSQPERLAVGPPDRCSPVSTRKRQTRGSGGEDPPTLPSEQDTGPRSSAGEEEGAEPPGPGSETLVLRPRTAAAPRLGQGSPGLGGQVLLGRAAAGLGPGGEHRCACSTRPGPDSWRRHGEAQVTQCCGWRRVGSRAQAARPGHPVSLPSPLFCVHLGFHRAPEGCKSRAGWRVPMSPNPHPALPSAGP